MNPSTHNPYFKHGSLVIDLLKLKSGKYRKILFLERFFIILLCLTLMLTPAMFVRWISGVISKTARKLSIELYVLLKTGAAVFLLFNGLWAGSQYVILAGVSLIDLFSNILAIVLLRNFWHAPLSLNRTLISLGLNFVEFTAWFAGLYLHFNALRFESKPVLDSFSAYYFSVITSATIGFGDIIPTIEGRRLVVAEAFCSFIFLAVVVTYVISSLGQSVDDTTQET
jgi:hypothetical protein